MHDLFSFVSHKYQNILRSDTNEFNFTQYALKPYSKNGY